MRFIPITPAQRDEMLRVVGVASADELFDVVPDSVRLDRPLALPSGITEMELVRELAGLSDRDLDASRVVSFLGAGCYDHFIPSIVDAVVSKPEFFTAYTPYQPEISQGTLQAIFEYQSMICALTGMDVSNASMYDGATAMVEAAYLASTATKRGRVIVADTVHPEWLETMRTYALAGTLEIATAASRGGVIDVEALAETVSDAAAVIVADPNFYGNLEDLAAIGRVAHDAGALFVVAVNPMLSGVLAPPADYGADVVVGEGQPLGNAMSFGGPGFGFFACRDQFLRRMPGRIVGRTVDVDGRPAFVLTMQTREQHIRREKATSNICSNQALCALAASVYLSSLGPQGLAEVGRACVAKAHYLHDRLIETGRFTPAYPDASFAHEFALAYDGNAHEMQETMLERGFLAGVELSRFSAELSGIVLFAVTEKRTREEMDRFVGEVASL
jgi:glycine dehydrogenase subunit 1